MKEGDRLRMPLTTRLDLLLFGFLVPIYLWKDPRWLFENGAMK